MTQTFISESSGPLVVQPGLSCWSFPLISITEHGNAKRYLRSPLFQTYSSLALLHSSSLISLVVRVSSTCPNNYSLLCWFRDKKTQTECQSKFPVQWNFSVSWWKCSSFSSTEYKVAKVRKQNLGSVSLGIIVNGATLIFSSWFLNLCIRAMRETASHIRQWFRTFWRSLSQTCKVLTTYLALCVFKRPLCYKKCMLDFSSLFRTQSS